MSDLKSYDQTEIRQTRFPMSIFWMIFLSLLIMSGIHIGLMVLMNELQWNNIVQVHLILLYWILVAMGMTLFVQRKMKKVYELPLQRISRATKKVAQGDFSVYIEPTHTMDKRDYLDAMIMDINKMVEELGSIETLKTDFISNVSHEMKTPIAIIKNSAQIMQKGTLTVEQQEEYAKSIEQAAGRLSALITNILKLNKLENQKIVPQSREYDVCRQLCDCIIQYEQRWEDKNISMEIEMDEEACVRADEELMELVWSNLLSNAIKFTEPGGRITVRQITAGGKVQVEITDTGCGMEEESIKHIFDKFYQGDTSHATEGNGLGLALVYRIMQLLDGNIYAASQKGEGSTFTVILPSGTAGRNVKEDDRRSAIGRE